MSHIPSELKYATSHEWIRVEANGEAVVGITEHAQELLGDIWTTRASSPTCWMPKATRTWWTKSNAPGPCQCAGPACIGARRPGGRPARVKSSAPVCPRQPGQPQDDPLSL